MSSQILKFSLRTRSLSPYITSRWLSQAAQAVQEVSKTEQASKTAMGVEQKSTKPIKEPFAKNLFLGKFDTDALTYPEVLDNERLETLNEMVTPIEKFFAEQVDSTNIDREGKIPKETMDGLKALGLFGQQIPIDYGGLGLNATEYARIGEAIAVDAAIGTTLAAHQSIGLKGLLIAGTDDQKARYLPKLATGEWVAAFCLTEPSSGSDAASIQTRATLAEDGKTWLLNGGKLWITNGGIADFFTVFAKTEVMDAKSGKKVDKVTAFAVERGFGGVTNGKPEDKLGIRGSNTCEVFFDNTPVPAENVIGEVGAGFKVAMNILNSGRFSMGSMSAGGLKSLLKLVTEHITNRKQFGKELKDFELIQEKIARITLSTYAMESMSYLVAGMLDGYEKPDCSVEAAMVKVYSSENSWVNISECLQMLGGLGYMKAFPYERMLRDIRICMIFEGTNEILRLFIALNGLQHAGAELRDVVKKLRNPLFHPGLVIGKLLERRGDVNDNPKLTLGLGGHLHPSLEAVSKLLEYSVMRLKYAVELTLQRHGSQVLEHQMDLKRLADVGIDVLAMTAVLGRASRSYCIGLRNADSEMLLARTFCHDAYRRVQINVRELEAGEVVNNDANYRSIAKLVVENGGYFAEHPLTRNF